MSESSKGPEGKDKNSVTSFAGLKIGISDEGLENIGRQSAVWKAVDYVRKLLADFQREADPENLYGGKILDTVPGELALERPLLEAMIYIVDDDKANGAIIQRFLSRRGFSNLKFFEDAQFALDTMYKDGKLVETPHLIISDTNMPKMQGSELAQALEGIDLAIRPRFIALTGNFFDKNIETYVSLNRPVLAKPIDGPGNVVALTLQELHQHPAFRPEK